MKKLALPLYFNPSPLLFLPFIQGYEVYYRDVEAFRKNTPRTNSTLVSSHGLYKLKVPVQAFGQNVPYRSIWVDEQGNWMRDHLRFLKSNYGKAPYFMFLQDRLEEIYLKRKLSLVDFNLSMISLALDILRVREEPALMSGISETQKIVVCNEAELEKLIKLDEGPRPQTWPTYTQLFGRGFAGGVGILDMVMCLGPDGKTYLEDLSKQIGDFERFCGKIF